MLNLGLRRQALISMQYHGLKKTHHVALKSLWNKKKIETALVGFLKYFMMPLCGLWKFFCNKSILFDRGITWNRMAVIINGSTK